MTDEPLIYTTKGNIPRSSVKQEQRWHYSDDDPNIVLNLVYTHVETGEVVRNDVHIYSKTGLQMGAVQAVLQ